MSLPSNRGLIFCRGPTSATQKPKIGGVGKSKAAKLNSKLKPPSLFDPCRSSLKPNRSTRKAEAKAKAKAKHTDIGHEARQDKETRI